MILASRLFEKKMLEEGTTYASYRYRENEFTKYFSVKGDLVHCNNIAGLLLLLLSVLRRPSRGSPLPLEN